MRSKPVQKILASPPDDNLPSEVLSEHLRDFKSKLPLLNKRNTPEYSTACMDLARLSRDMMFRTGPLQYANRQQLQEMIALFGQAVSVLDVETADSSEWRLLESIRQRRDALTTEMQAAGIPLEAGSRKMDR